MENNLLRRINELHRAQLEPLVKFLPLILDKLLLLMVKPPAFDGHILNVGPAAFNAIAMIVNKLTSSVSPFTLYCKDFRVALVRRLTAATAAITLGFLFVAMLCYVLGMLHSSCVLCSKIGLHRRELINKILVNDDFSKKKI